MQILNDLQSINWQLEMYWCDLSNQVSKKKKIAYFAAFQTPLTISLVQAQSVYTPLIKTCLSHQMIRVEGII